jgi:hypothetical protein
MTPVLRADRLHRTGRTGAVHRRRRGQPAGSANGGDRLSHRRADGRRLPAAALLRPDVVAHGGRIPDGRARPDERPDGLERRHHPHAGPHAQPVPAPALPQRRPQRGALPVGGKPVSLTDIRTPSFCVATSPTTWRPGARCTSCTTSLPARVHLRAHQRRPQRRHRQRTRPAAPPLPGSATARPAATTCRPTNGSPSPPAKKDRGGRNGRPGWPRTPAGPSRPRRRAPRPTRPVPTHRAATCWRSKPPTRPQRAPQAAAGRSGASRIGRFTSAAAAASAMSAYHIQS